MERARRELTDMRVVIAESYKEKEPLTQYQKDSCKCFWEYGKHIDEHLQALAIIVKKIWCLKDHKRCLGASSKYEEYVSNIKRRYRGSLKYLNKYKLTETEYDLVLKVVEEIEDELK